jgi:hypothetical protein
MALYRLYFLNGDGRIAHRLDMDCDDDHHAEKLVNAHTDGRSKELWQDTRRVRVFDRNPS